MPNPLDRPALLRVLDGERLPIPPVWFMRQAGRSLPEYRALRTRAPDFIAFCLNPQMAAEATLQPIRRFGFDAAIVFADILLVPRGLGQEVWFEPGEGPKLGPLPAISALTIDAVVPALSAVGETLQRVRAALPTETALIGFAGAPWTVATYMIEGGGSRDRSVARALAYAEPERVDALIDVLIEATALYLKMQADAGAQALQLFESWAEGLSEPLFQRLVIRPHQRLIARLRELGVKTPVIGFPRGAATSLQPYADTVPVQAVALDTTVTLAAGRSVQATRPIQGALDPLLLLSGCEALDRRVREMLAAWGQGPWIFNLGHGVLPDTPIDNIQRVLDLVRGGA